MARGTPCDGVRVTVVAPLSRWTICCRVPSALTVSTLEYPSRCATVVVTRPADVSTYPRIVQSRATDVVTVVAPSAAGALRVSTRGAVSSVSDSTAPEVCARAWSTSRNRVPSTVQLSLFPKGIRVTVCGRPSTSRPTNGVRSTVYGWVRKASIAGMGRHMSGLIPPV
ncbi:hypothetical protein Raf01_40230 [Rugosimonospora africana]|uniref:Uncharacterized protein n=1 Tax=Rugosimonospora africana TaxID=556532 RepID=A0A8J3VRU9_9ACTN|nr:hypothetical protein [Rugosimonospora africana]GIH15851.1 hypothetical protein Raf01_40230 [Rugosimonospora africana]